MTTYGDSDHLETGDCYDNVDTVTCSRLTDYYR